MNYKLLYCTLFLMSCNVTDKKDGSLNVVIDNCKYKSNENPYLNEIELYKNGEAFRNVSLNNQDEVNISNLPYGIYDLRYKSIYNIMEHMQIDIIDEKPKLITICIDKLDYNANRNVLLIDDMKIGETIRISFQSQGCFHFSENELELEKSKDGVIATYNEEKVTLSKTQYQLIRQFEIELRSNHVGGCSTIDRYGIWNEDSFGDYTLYDESCQWRGFTNLIKLLNL